MGKEPPKAVLFGLILPGHREHEGADPLAELADLAAAAGAVVVGSVIQRRSSPHASTYLGGARWRRWPTWWPSWERSW